MNDTFKVAITRREFLTLPMETRRRILSEQVNSSKEQIDAIPPIVKCAGCGKELQGKWYCPDCRYIGGGSQ